ncbi:PepSY domain-containing protein [Brevibacillus sp. DP1.3A]|uniref:PepSY domain-containing protein n=1 Tax=Brevibacillus sp. DP1.3A TaxID=2738867 RepID=UPI00156B72A9|nr:PepSY domain-containing protein [Brevibacillus sp. DP1.3A]UED75801.1 PepSY domain-containing protein [Brevibacillus sp. DP1.3A]
MNKKWKIGLLASFLLVTTAFGMQRIFASMDLQSLSAEEVKQIVTARYPGKIESISMTDVGENSIYNLQLLNERGTYSVMVNAYTGEIIDLKELSLVAATAQPKANETAANPTQPGSNPTASTAPQPNNGGKDASGNATKPVGTGTVAPGKQQPATTQTQTQQPKPNQSSKPPVQPQTKITEQQAKQIATERTSGGKIDDVDLIETKSGAVYRVITIKDSKTVDVRIHAITGKVLSTTTIDNSSTDDDDDDLTPVDKNGSAPADKSSSDDKNTNDTDDDDLDDGDDD